MLTEEFSSRSKRLRISKVQLLPSEFTVLIVYNQTDVKNFSTCVFKPENANCIICFSLAVGLKLIFYTPQKKTGHKKLRHKQKAGNSLATTFILEREETSGQPDSYRKG